MSGQLVRFADLHRYVGKYLGVSGWIAIEQAQINRFADLTGDNEWIHVDVNRATVQLGGTIVHGYHLLSLIPALSQQIFQVEGISHGLNYGIDRLRFVETVSPRNNLRLHQTLLSVTSRGAATMMMIEAKLEIEGKSRPALVASCQFLLFPTPPS